jgi:sensor c-di-GMP phosphodiesterase-like protein
LRDEGFQISIDDFGTGYSNLNQIASMECNAIKIDRSFVADMETGSIKSSIIPHVVGMAEALKLRVVAEGVENEAQAKKLEEMQVEYGQGWLFGRPMTAMNFSRHLETVSTYQKSKKSA